MYFNYLKWMVVGIVILITVNGQSFTADSVITFTSAHIFSNDAYTINYQEIRQTPLRGIRPWLTLRPFVVDQDNQLHIRGSRAGENRFYLNGFDITNPLTHEREFYLIPEFVRSMEVYPGNAPIYLGYAVGGVVHIHPRLGQIDPGFSLSYQGDPIAERGRQTLGAYSYGYHDMVATYFGQPFSDLLAVGAALQYEEIGDTQKRFSKGFRFEELVDTGRYASDPPDTVSAIEYPDGFTPNNRSYRWAWNSQIEYRQPSFTLNWITLWQKQKLYADDRPMLNILNNREQYQLTQQLFTGLTFKHKPMDHLKYRLQVGYSIHKYDTFDEWLGNDWRFWRDSLKIARKSNGTVISPDRWEEPKHYEFNGIRFEKNGSINSRYYRKGQRRQWQVSGQLSTDILKDHHLTLGFDGHSYTLRQYSMVKTAGSFLQTSNPDAEEFRDWFYRNSYGYTVYGSKNNGHLLDGARTPQFAALYVHDRIQHNKVTLDMGLRLDYLQTDDIVTKNQHFDRFDFDEQWIDGVYDADRIDAGNWKEKSALIHLSPRVSLTTALNDRWRFRAHYGRYVQAPKLYDLYNNSYNMADLMSFYFYVDRAVGINVDAVSANHFELNVTSRLTDQSTIRATAFYRTIHNQLISSRHFAPDSSYSFKRLDNRGRSKVTGLELSLQLMPLRWLQLRADYALTHASGMAAHPTENLTRIDRMLPVSQSLYPLSYEHRHKGIVRLGYHTEDRFKGLYLNDTRFFMQYRFNSGHPFTLRYVRGFWGSGYDTGVDYMYDRRANKPMQFINDNTTPWNHWLDVQVQKDIRFSRRLRMTLFMRVLNVLNTKNILNVYEYTGNAEQDGFINDPDHYDIRVKYYGERYLDLYKAINIENGQSYWDLLNKELFGHPRQIIFGLNVYFL
ncbi:MAG: TonB-dependent receptor [Caldithrix sp.]|nr:TonB-dependent receptor [Caldithrix sp.]